MQFLHYLTGLAHGALPILISAQYMDIKKFIQSLRKNFKIKISTIKFIIFFSKFFRYLKQLNYPYYFIDDIL